MPGRRRAGLDQTFRVGDESVGLGQDGGGQGERLIRPGRWCLILASQRGRRITQQVQRLLPPLGKMQRESHKKAPHDRRRVLRSLPPGAQLRGERSTGCALVERPMPVAGKAIDPFLRRERIVSRARGASRRWYQPQVPLNEGGGAAKSQSLFADQGIEIEAALVARRGGSDRADRRQQDNEHRRRDAEDIPTA